MARNPVQFQKGMSEAAFDQKFGTEERCWAHLVEWRWPNGFECPCCGGRKYCVVCQTASKSDPQTAPNNDPLTAVVECPVSVMTS
jgi:hypothetical protein